MWNIPNQPLRKRQWKLLQNDENDINLDEMVRNINNDHKAVVLIKRNEGILKSKNNRMKNFAGHQRFLLKRFKEEKEFLDLVGLSWLHANFKIRLNDFLLEYPFLKKSDLAPSYLKTNFKLISKPCRKYPLMFTKNWIFLNNKKVC